MSFEPMNQTAAYANPFQSRHMAEDFVWATSEEARLRALLLYLIRSIVQKYGGTIHVDLETDSIRIDVPPKYRAACAEEVEREVGDMGSY